MAKATIDAGRFMQIHRGAYSILALYEFNDIVTDNGSSFCCIAEDEKQTRPQPPATGVWELVAARGEQGIQGIQGNTGDQGYTPQREVDYWTDEDKAAITSEMTTMVQPSIDNADAAAARANDGAAAAELVVDDVKAAVLESASTGNHRTTIDNPVTIHPGAGSMLGVVGDADGVLWHAGQNWSDPSQIAIGSINANAGNEVTGVNRVRTGYLMLPAGKIGHISGVPATLRPYVYYYYDISKAYLGYNDTGVILPNAQWMRITYCNTASSSNAITQDEHAAMVNSYQYAISDAVAPYQPFVGLETLPLTAGQPITTKAYGDDTLIASAGLLKVGYNEDSLYSDMTHNWVSATATGKVAQLDGCVGGVPMRIIAEVDTPQEGVPSPDSPVAIVGKDSISGRVCAGNNLAPRPVSRSLNGLTYTVSSDGSFVINGTPTGNSNNRIDLPVPLPPGTYTLSINNPVALGAGGSDGIAVQLYDEGNAVISGAYATTNAINAKATFTTTVPAVAINIRVPVAAGALTNFAMAVQVETGTIATPYAPHRAYPITYTPPKPMYGLEGARDAWEPTVGRLTQLLQDAVFNGTESWAVSSVTGADGITLFSKVLPGAKLYGASIATGNVMCDSYNPVTTVFSTMRVGDCRVSTNSLQTTTFLYLATGDTTLDELYARLAANPVKVVYELATPIVTYFDPLDTPSYPGTNTVYTDAGGDVTIMGHQTAQYTAEQLRAAEIKNLKDRLDALLGG